MTIPTEFAIEEPPPAGRTQTRLDLMVDVSAKHTLFPSDTCGCGEAFTFREVGGRTDTRSWQRHVMQAVLLAVIDSVGTELPEPIASAVQAARLVDDLAVHQVLASHKALLEEIRVALISYQALEEHYGGELADARADVDTLVATVRERQSAIEILARELYTVRRELAEHDRQAARDRIVRQAHRAYGRASRTIGAQRALIDQNRLRLDETHSVIERQETRLITARTRLRLMLGLESPAYSGMSLEDLLDVATQRLRPNSSQGDDRRG
ncbi:hypothetical protein [Saccharothrix texasensis]|uniref:Uncharacterized protein n=1 Tax=Saccharothrix texasensis TaxID=103734 RepID=A0A3N1H169_9PSEU|nr:hypothetical protein [Saccharothrix texasensis]ROP36260.1 hypothetical protein EDD40_1525 [Saccharothrix texasensis]